MIAVHPLSAIRNPALRWAAPRLSLAVALVALADGLFLPARRPVGLSMSVYLLALAAAALALNPARARRARRIGLVAAFAAALVPLIEDVNLLSLAQAMFALALMAMLMGAGETPLRRVVARRLAALPFVGAVWLVGDARRVSRLARVKARPAALAAMMASWVLPLALLGLFLLLFAVANPLIEQWLLLIDFRWLLDAISPDRIVFWVFILVLIWPFVHMRRMRATRPIVSAPRIGARNRGLLFSDAAVLRSLVLFNALFALQTAMDLAYLWGGARLPQGMTLADYAHRGAYPLILTAMLAAAFVLLTMRPGGPAGRSPLVRPLVLIWIAQNVALVISAILRLDLYVAALSLTYWRLAAFIWMGLVFAGLVLIIVQIAAGKSVAWLVRMNVAALTLALYGASLANLPAFIAAYNVAHSAEMGGGDRKLDVGYVVSLGPQAIPALDLFYARTGLTRYDHARRHGAFEIGRALSDWRSWSFRAWRLNRYLATDAQAAPPAVDAAPNVQP